MSEYTKIDRYTGEIPNYSIATAMDLYETSENCVIPLFLQSKEKFLSDQDAYHTVVSDEINRIDLISYRYYGTSEYWWVILLANGIFNPFDIAVGDVLRIPTTATVLTKWLR